MDINRVLQPILHAAITATGTDWLTRTGCHCRQAGRTMHLTAADQSHMHQKRFTEIEKPHECTAKLLFYMELATRIERATC